MLDRTEYKTYSATFLANMGLTVYPVRKVLGWHAGGASLFLSCAAAVCEKTAVPSSFNQTSRYFINRGKTEPAALRLDFLAGGALRIRLQRGEVVQDIPRPMLAAAPAPGEAVAVEESETALTAKGGGITAVIAKDPFCLTIQDANGQTLYTQYNDDAHSTTADRRRGLSEAESTLTPEEVANSYPALEAYPFGFVVDDTTGETCYTEAVRMAHDEAFFGFGEAFGKANKNGEEKLIWSINPLGASTIKSYKPVPFFMSNKGYGLYLNSAKKSLFDMGSYFFKAYTVASFDTQLDLFFLPGPSYETMLQAYCGLTGQCRHVPPKWSFGVWMGRNCYRTRAEIEEVCRELRRRQLPCDVIHLDWAWTRYETHGFDFRFDESRYPDPAAMMREMKQQGYRLSLWQLPYLNKGTPVYEECLQKGYFPAPPPGKENENTVGVLDFSNPDAVAWYQRQLRALLQMGVAVVKTDFGENADEDYAYHSLPGSEMHNLYPLLYNDAAYAVCEEVHGDEALVWGRSAFSGGQRFPLYWAGDSDSDYAGMFHTLRGGLSLGLSGFPFWSHDVGGYYSAPEPDVYIRWMQLGMLSSHVRFHGTAPREPWHYGETAVAVYQTYAAIRYSLIEYLYAEAHHAVESCTPMMRHLALDFGDDPTVLAIDDAYMLGRNLLVAGVFGNNPVRRLYLPEGRWLDWHTGEIFDGGRWIDYPTPIETMPLFLRFGTATPLVEAKNHVDEFPDKVIRWKILPGKAAIQAAVLGLGAPVVLTAAPAPGGLTVTVCGGAGRRHILEIHGANRPAGITGGALLSYDEAARLLRVETTGGGTAAITFSQPS